MTYAVGMRALWAARGVFARNFDKITVIKLSLLGTVLATSLAGTSALAEAVTQAAPAVSQPAKETTPVPIAAPSGGPNVPTGDPTKTVADPAKAQTQTPTFAATPSDKVELEKLQAMLRGDTPMPAPAADKSQSATKLADATPAATTTTAVAAAAVATTPAVSLPTPSPSRPTAR